MPLRMTLDAQRQQQMIGIIPRRLKLIVRHHKVVLPVVHMQRLPALAYHAAMPVSVENCFPAGLPFRVKHQGLVRSMRLWNVADLFPCAGDTAPAITFVTIIKPRPLFYILVTAPRLKAVVRIPLNSQYLSVLS